LRVYVYPADMEGCGHLRLIWPAEILRARGHDVRIIPPADRDLWANLTPDGEHVESIRFPQDADVLVFQRVTHRFMAEGIAWLARRRPVVIDIDDDLAAIHPSNPAWAGYHPKFTTVKDDGTRNPHHAWAHLNLACQAATLVTVSTDALLTRYAPHGRGRVVRNRFPAGYLDVSHPDSDVIGWPASLHSHPDDPAVCRQAISRVVREGARFRTFGSPEGTGRAFGLPGDAEAAWVPFDQWARRVSDIGIGIVPLADTRFNRGKSWLKGLDLAALGVPFVASPRAEYRRLHRLGAGVLADKPAEWLRHLRRLLASPDYRAELGGHGRRSVAHLTLEAAVGEWWQAWAWAADRRPVPPPPPKPPSPAALAFLKAMAAPPPGMVKGAQ
jgi:hypothetical protein